jgi:hypothetical protein
MGGGEEYIIYLLCSEGARVFFMYRGRVGRGRAIGRGGTP